MRYSDIILSMVPRPAESTFDLTLEDIEAQLEQLRKRGIHNQAEQGKRTVVAFDMVNAYAAYTELQRAQNLFTGARWAC